jgi:hypothetical protein
MANFKLVMEINVFDEALLLKKAQEFATEKGFEGAIEGVDDAIIMLLDPGSGGGAYDGPMFQAGIEIEESHCGKGW